MKKVHLGNRLKVARAEKDLSQEDLAKLAGDKANYHFD